MVKLKTDKWISNVQIDSNIEGKWKWATSAERIAHGIGNKNS